MMRVTFVFDSSTKSLNDMATDLIARHGARQILFEAVEEPETQIQTPTTEKAHG